MDKNEIGMNRLLQDLWWRQRNIVFPDTVRNEGILYRNAARSDQVRDPLQRVGIMMAAVPCFMFACAYLLLAIGFFVEHGLFALIPALIGLGVAGVSFAIGAKLAMAAVFNSKRPPVHPDIIRRRRISGRK